ncbi:MAG TPA: lytic transglycosylase domain-containing protein [Candidatus Blautia stercoravium]|nr:lytic transglycosylase domain-containing protein [Candidatus Blautia stercoravium]
MAIDYTLYNNQYRYMENILQQIRMGSQSGLGYETLSSSVSGISNFSDVMRQAQSVSSGVSAGSMDSIFEEAAQAYNVPVNLLKAIGKAESDFDPYAESAAGAQGVMQLMPETARSLGVTDPFDARSNIMGGAKYISDKLKQYDGDIDLALAAYNAGSGNVAKYGGVPPFAETQNYIKKVREYMGTDLETGRSVSSVSNQTGVTGLSSQFPVCGSSQAGSIANWLSEFLRLQLQSRMISAEDYTNTII